MNFISGNYDIYCNFVINANQNIVYIDFFSIKPLINRNQLLLSNGPESLTPKKIL